MVLRREVVVSLVLGGFLALIGFVVAFFIAPSPQRAMVIPLTLVSVVVVRLPVAVPRCRSSSNASGWTRP